MGAGAFPVYKLLMKKYDFQICGMHLTLAASRPLKTGGDMLHFTCGKQHAGLTVACNTTAQIPEPQGEVRSRRTEWLVCLQGSIVSRCRVTQPDAPPYARLDYDLSEPSRAKLTVREADWSWATDHLRIWATLCLPQLLLPFRTLVFHASYIGCAGKGILFTAPSGTGKSTQAELWRVHRGARVHNGDKAAVTLRESPMVHGVPFSGTSGICENVSLPLGAIVVLSQAPENSVRRLGPVEAVSALCSNLFVDQCIQQEWQLALNLLLDFVASVPVYALACTPDERAVEALEQAMGDVQCLDKKVE